jgi:hypothetical protein
VILRMAVERSAGLEFPEVIGAVGRLEVPGHCECWNLNAFGRRYPVMLGSC